MKLTPIIAQLKARCPSLAERVAGVTQYAADKNAISLATPCAYVIPLNDYPESNKSSVGIRQKLVDGFGIVVALDVSGNQAASSTSRPLDDQVDVLRTELWAALLNWLPGASYDGIEYLRASLISLDATMLWWQFDFGARIEIDADDGYQATYQPFEGMTVLIDQIDPGADPDRNKPGPDGRIEAELHFDNLQTS